MNLLKLTCIPFWWFLFHRYILRCESVSMEDLGDLNTDFYQYMPAYFCQEHHHNHWCRMSKRDIEILELPEWIYVQNDDEAWRLQSVLENKPFFDRFFPPFLRTTKEAGGSA